VVLVHLLTFLQLTTDVCNAATVGEVFEADSSKAASYTGRIMPAWNQLRTACTEDFSQGAVVLLDGICAVNDLQFVSGQVFCILIHCVFLHIAVCSV